ncbi:MAG: polyamine aminopropyltransferase [Candidatus Altiarchaeales archaeon]|nr:polyamine aminopropyltransferase [Candidatus Altiarchaeales archaeon]MBD3416809.1 polyamine aminopropyltransferase [Candidatus Altiarchaeales archaeon]
MSLEGYVVDARDLSRGRTIALEATCVLEDFKTEYQHIQVFETRVFGKVLLLDGIVMLTEFDEFAYHEMIAHVPLFSHPDPRSVLIIGGGDGGAARESAKHPGVERIDVCEIDEKVIEVSKKHFPDVACGYDDPRVNVIVEDASEHIKEGKGGYDVIIVDSTDPVGPGEPLFKEEFYQHLHDSLTDDGIAVTQSESMFYDLELIKKMAGFNRRIFPIYSYYFCLIPTYPSGHIGFSYCSKRHGPKPPESIGISGLRYYNPEIHRSSFVLPEFAKERIE